MKYENKPMNPNFSQTVESHFYVKPGGRNSKNRVPDTKYLSFKFFTHSRSQKVKFTPETFMPKTTIYKIEITTQFRFIRPLSKKQSLHENASTVGSINHNCLIKLELRPAIVCESVELRRKIPEWGRFIYSWNLCFLELQTSFFALTILGFDTNGFVSIFLV